MIATLLVRIAGSAASLRAFLLARAAEPGTLRSVAVIVFALKGIVPDQATLQAVFDSAILVLGAVSALMPEATAKAAAAAAMEAVQASVPAALQAAAAAPEVAIQAGFAQALGAAPAPRA